MDNKQIKKLTLADFIERKTQRDNDKTTIKEVYIPSMEGYITIVKCSMKDACDCCDKTDESNSTSGMVEAYKQLIYNNVPMLKNPELQAEYELVEPFDIVEQVFELGEIIKLGNEFLAMHGLRELLEPEIKNSSGTIDKEE